MTSYIDKGARISPCGRYRYRLWREWRLGDSQQWDMWTEEDGSPVVDGAGHQLGEPRSCVFVMLNPSTADGEEDDPTIGRCVGFARSLGYDRMEVVNLFAFRSTDPRALLTLPHGEDPVGHENERHVEAALTQAGMIICAWGTKGSHLTQDETMLGWIDRHNHLDAPVMALRTTKHGFPEHPLYVPAATKPIAYRGRP